MKNRITKKTTLAEILSLPEAEEVLLKYKLPCLGCPFIRMEAEDLEIGEVCRAYGIDAKKLIEELNKKLF